jgi:hypothetical protein
MTASAPLSPSAVLGWRVNAGSGAVRVLTGPEVLPLAPGASLVRVAVVGVVPLVVVFAGVVL